MIKTELLSKSFGKIKAVNDVSVEIGNSGVFGLVGTNGAGKSTFLRMLCGILKQDSGNISIDGQPVYENSAIKSKLIYISDDQYYFSTATALELMEYYRMLYPAFDKKRFLELLQGLGLDGKRKVNAFSKGMKKLLSILLALCANVPYIYCDETMDGLDPVMRRTVKSLFAAEVTTRGLTPVVASHNLRELEDICDHIGLLHQGGLLLSRELDAMKSDLHKVQAVFPYQLYPQAFHNLQVVSMRQSGNMYTLILRGDAEQVRQTVAAKRPIYMEMLPLSLEEAFICETEVAGYEFQNLFL